MLFHIRWVFFFLCMFKSLNYVIKRFFLISLVNTMICQKQCLTTIQTNIRVNRRNETPATLGTQDTGRRPPPIKKKKKKRKKEKKEEHKNTYVYTYTHKIKKARHNTEN